VFTFVISLVVIGAALAIAARIVMNGAPQPATDAAPRGRERVRRRRSKEVPAVAVVAPAVAGQAAVERVGPTPWWVRARAVVLLSALVALLGAFLALLLVLGGALILTGLRNAVQ
jgi:hypothetical protein